MNRPTALLRVLTSLSLLGVLTSACHGQQPPEDPADARLKTLLTAKVRFDRYVFSGDAFPACAFEEPGKLEQAMGPFKLKTTFYDEFDNTLQKPKDYGEHFAVVEALPKDGPPVRRYVTLFSLNPTPSDDTRFDPTRPADFAKAVRFPDAVIMKAERPLAETFKDRPFSELAHDPRTARALAGIRRGLGSAGEQKNVDPFAYERQAWVHLERKLKGLDEEFPNKLKVPTYIKGIPAPVVHEGSEKEAGVKPGTAEKIDAVLKEWADNDDQAFAVCIVRHGVIVLHKAYGTRDGKPITVDTKSWMASITKPMSATLMMMLVDQGLVKLDDPVDKFVPQLRGIKVETPLTIRHLYTHTSGLDKLPPDLYQDELPDIEERVALAYPTLKVGKAWAYNGQGYALGGKIIENVSGEAIPLFFAKHLLAPLEMTGTDVVGTHADAYSVPLDIAKFGQMLLNKGAYGQYRFLKEETFAQMLPHKLTEVLGPDTMKTFGVGLDGKPEAFGHGAASAATFSVNVTDDLVVVMTRNKMGKNQEKYNGKFWDAIREGLVKP